MSVVVSVDYDDPIPDAVFKFLHREHVHVNVGPPRGKIAAINRGIALMDWDAVVATADDMIPLDGWDEMIRQDLVEHGKGAINYNVDARLCERWQTLMVLPVLTREVYNHFGYVYNPLYISEWCDNEQTAVLNKFGWLVHLDKQPFRHEWLARRDGLSLKNEALALMDRTTFEIRQKYGFV